MTRNAGRARKLSTRVQWIITDMASYKLVWTILSFLNLFSTLFHGLEGAVFAVIVDVFFVLVILDTMYDVDS